MGIKSCVCDKLNYTGGKFTQDWWTNPAWRVCWRGNSEWVLARHSDCRTWEDTGSGRHSVHMCDQCSWENTQEHQCSAGEYTLYYC